MNTGALAFAICGLAWLAACMFYLIVFRDKIKSVFAKSFWDTFFSPNILLIPGFLLVVSAL